MKYSMTCSCGHVMEVEAPTREAAVSQLQGTMTDEAIAQHMQEKHPGEAAMPKAQVHEMIAKMLAPAA